MGSVIALTNQKGGVGKTTLAVNLVACLSDVWMKTDRKILLIDTDIQANATFLLSRESYAYRDTIGALFQDEILPSGRRLIHETGRKNLFLGPSSPQMAAEEQRIPFRERRGERLSLFLKEVGDDYDLVIIDCPPALNIFVLNAFFASDSILVPMPPEELAVQGFEQLMGQIAAVRSVNPDLSFLGVVINMFTERILVQSEIRSFLEEQFGDRVLGLIHRSIILQEASASRTTVADYAPHSRAYEEYRRLAERVASEYGLM